MLSVISVAPSVDDGLPVIEASASPSAIASLFEAAQDAGELGHALDGLNLSQTAKVNSPFELDTHAYRLEADLLDLLLRQELSGPEDAIVLLLVAVERSGALKGLVEKGERPLAEAVSSALRALARWQLATTCGDVLDRLPPRLRDATRQLVATSDAVEKES